MSDWQKKLDLKDVYLAGMPIPELAAIVAKRLRKVGVPESDKNLEDEREHIAEQLEELSSDQNASDEEFNEIMAQLYDWANTPLDNKFGGKKLCWIATF